MLTIDLSTSYPNTGSTAANSRAPLPKPKDPNLPHEPTGPIASDSLAAESLKSGGTFAANKHVEPLGVKDASSTLNVTDTSGAKELKPAPDASHRNGGDKKFKYPEDAGKSAFAGPHSEHGYVGGPLRDRATQDETQGEDATKQASSSSGNSGGGNGGGETTHDSGSDHHHNNSGNNHPHPIIEPAPTAFGKFWRASDLKPKGKNIHEEADLPEDAQPVTDDVGGPNDPAYITEKEWLIRNADASRGGAGGPRQYETEKSPGPYSVLDPESTPPDLSQEAIDRLPPEELEPENLGVHGIRERVEA